MSGTPKTGTIEVSGGAIAYRQSGTGSAVVFAHGLGGNLRSWWQQEPAFALRFTCVTFSHRGFALSRDDTGVPRPALFAQDLQALLDHLGIDHVAIVAQSMGGWTALEFARLAPARVNALVLAGTTGSFTHPSLMSLSDTNADPHVQRLRQQGINPAAGARMARQQPDLYRHYVEISEANGSLDRGEVSRRLDAMRIRTAADIHALTMPLFLLVGAEDLVCPPANVALLAETAGCPMTVIPDAGHSAYFETAPVFNNHVLDILSAQ